ncbi:MAG: quinone oxidoreductase family protein [Streptosporangiaceae bacterium]
MRALVLTGPASDASTTAVQDIAVPRPGPGEVAIDVTCAGINFIDVMARRGDPGYATSWPYVPGLEVAGTVREVGEGVRGRRVGDPVAAFTAGGGLAQVAIAADAVTVSVPESVSLAVAASAPLMWSTAVLLLTEVARIRAGESILMHSAAGGVGSAVAQVARLLGAGTTIGTVGLAGKVSAADAAGWDVALARGPGLAAAVRAVTPAGVDIVLDPTGTGLLDLDLEIAAPGARVVLFGNAAGGAPAPLPTAGRLIGGNVGVLGLSVSRLATAAGQRYAAALAHALAMLETGRLSAKPALVDSLSDVAAVHDLLAAGDGRGKYVVAVDR